MAIKHVQIFNAERKESVYPGGRKSVSFICQAIILEDTEVGEIRVSEALAKQWLTDEGQLPVGVYAVDCSLGVGWQDKKMGGQLSSFEKVARANNPVGLAAVPSASVAHPAPAAHPEKAKA